MVVGVVLAVGGLALLTAGADRLVVSAAQLARTLGLSTVVIGALVVGMGTSAPEFLVTVLAAARGELDLAVGNVVGSNVANVSLVLGSTALMAPIVGTVATMRREGVLMLTSVVGLALVLLDLRLGRPEAVVLAVGMIGAAVLLVRWARKDVDLDLLEAQVEALAGSRGRSIATQGLAALISLAATLIGAQLFLDGAERIAVALDLSQAFIGLTLVAIGTSLPELATALAAARRGEHDLVVGNVLGSNLFNSLAVVGVAGIAAPGVLVAELRTPTLVMVGIAAAAGWLSITGNRLVRWEGAVLLAGFAGFLVLTF